MMKRYYKKTIIYSEEKVGNNVLRQGEFTTKEDITDQKDKLIKDYGEF